MKDFLPLRKSFLHTRKKMIKPCKLDGARMKNTILYIFATIGVASTICFSILLINPIQHSETEIARIQSNYTEYDAVLTDTSLAAFGSPIIKIYIVPKGMQFNQGSKFFRFPVFENEYIRKQDVYWNMDGNLVINNGQHSIRKFESGWYDLRNDFENTKPENWKGVMIILKTGAT